jgi:hypothetical protein
MELSEDEVTKEMRQISKSANFGLLYGSGARGLRNYAAGMGVQMDLAEAGEIRAKFHAVYTGISRWQRENAAQANRHRSDAAIRIRNSGCGGFYLATTTRLRSARIPQSRGPVPQCSSAPSVTLAPPES